jgi:choline dehydrogenase-like flavoprotein
VIGHPHAGIHTARERVVGGTTIAWAGQALPFWGEDFERRDWVSNSGWPIGLDILQPYYDRAERVLGIPHSGPFGAGLSQKAGAVIFSQDKLSMFYTKWSPHPNSAKYYFPDVRRSNCVRLIYKANATKIGLSPDSGRVECIVIKSISGKVGKITASVFILAGGAIEIARLLLASNDVQQGGGGNDAGLVGRYFQDHTACAIGLVVPDSRTAAHDVFEPYYYKGFRYLPRIGLTPDCAAGGKVLHASLQVVFPSDPDDNIVAIRAFGKHLLSGQWNQNTFRAAVRAARSPTNFATAVWRRTVEKREMYSRSGPLWLVCHSEQEPLANSRVTLAETCDALGMPRVRLDWKISHLTRSTLQYLGSLAVSEFQKSGLGRVVLEEWINSPNSDWKKYLEDLYHQCGTARMARTRHEGVVDDTCKVFSVGNLFIASSAVFPTSSFMNPTMTIIALSLRAGDRVKEILRR